jgi:hypothetical protein
MKFYTLASSSRECFGHGDYGTVQRISREGDWGSGPFPPLFKTKEDAEKYRSRNQFDNREIVEMEVSE